MVDLRDFPPKKKKNTCQNMKKGLADGFPNFALNEELEEERTI